MDWAHFSEYGLIGTIVGVLFLILYRIIVWTMALVKEQSAQQLEERKSWIVVVTQLKESIQMHNQQSIEARTAQQQAHEYQRQEHAKLMDQMTEAAKEQSRKMNEVTQALGRINGYKEHL
jgi:Na+-transporting NADH:ubiquinone oxidoreductase subunit NqrC